MKELTLESLIDIMNQKNYPLFEKKDYNINTIGVRSTLNDESGEESFDRFNDRICVFYKVNKNWVLYTYQATTVPGRFYLQNPMMPDFGAAILVPGFYQGAYVLGYHFSKPALQQVGKLKLFRDKNQNAVFDLDINSIQEVDWAGINIHYSVDRLKSIGKWSAGCQVLRYGPESPKYREFIKHYRQAITYGWRNVFSYGLVLEEDIK